jgi:uncharacterized protein (TIGR02996 family)
VTTEYDFWKLLEENPDDYQTRLIFADWLQDRNDDRAEGMRALGLLRLRPLPSLAGTFGWCCLEMYKDLRSQAVCDLPTDWYALLPGTPHRACTPFPNRPVAEGLAALAFTRLPPERRTALLESGL